MSSVKSFQKRKGYIQINSFYNMMREEEIMSYSAAEDAMIVTRPSWLLRADAEEEVEEELEVEESKPEETVEVKDEDKGLSSIMERLKEYEKKKKAADLVSKLRGKKRVNKKIMPYEIYATAGE